MKKLMIATIATTLLLTACSSSPTKSKAVKKIQDLDHICLKEAEKPKLASFLPTVAEYLQQRGIQSKITVEDLKGCRYALSYALNAENDLIVNSKVRLSRIDRETGSIEKRLGEVSYWQKSSEKEKVAQTGLKGQVKTMLDELLVNN